MLAVVARESNKAQAAERIDAIHAGATVKARTASNITKKKNEYGFATSCTV